jgi:spermidine synthase
MYKICIFTIVVLILSLIFLFYRSYKNTNIKPVEGMNNYYSNRPKSSVLINKDGVQITNLGKFGKCLVINNEIQLCDKDEHVYHEMIVHFPVQYLKTNLENVVIVGGGDLMTLREVMKYKTVKNVYILEINPKIVELCKTYFDQNEFPQDERVKIIYGDANETIHHILDTQQNKVDMVIVDSTEDNEDNLVIDQPDFFQKCLALLHKNGLLIKNGAYFKSLFESYYDLNTISYNVQIPYFQETYYFTIVAKTTNDIRKVEIGDSRWDYYNINTKFYNLKKHNKFIIHENYVDDAGLFSEQNVSFYDTTAESRETMANRKANSDIDEVFIKLL